MPVFLISDILYFLVLIGFGGYTIYVFRNPHLLSPWKKLFRNRLAAGSFVVVAIYISIALFDSMHFRIYDKKLRSDYSTQVVSVLDVILSRFILPDEESYSAPFATHALTKKTRLDENGNVTRYHPKLQHVLILSRGEKRWENLVLKVTKSVFFAILTTGLLVVFALFLIACLTRRRSTQTILQTMLEVWCHGKQQTHWRAILITGGLFWIVLYVTLNLSQYFHVMGTDKIGQDVLLQAIKSIRTGVLIGTLTTMIMLPFAILLGICAGYFLGRADDIIQYIYTTLNSIPGVLLIAAAVLVMHVYMERNPQHFADITTRSDVRLVLLCAILGITGWTGLCRLLRAETLKIKELNYIDAARSLHTSNWKILVHHIVPNVMHIVFITVALDFSGLVLAEAVLSYISIGVDPTMSSWGNMINGARLEMAQEPIVWWSLVASLVLMFGLVLSTNIFADRVREAFDPKT